MAVKWFSAREKNGTASFYNSNLTLNIVASVPFEYAYRVQVGIDDDKNIVIQPLSKERVERGDLDEYAIQKISVKKTYARISSTSLMKSIGEALGVEFTDSPMKYLTQWDEVENILTILTSKGVIS